VPPDDAREPEAIDLAKLPDHVRANRDHWTTAAPAYATAGERAWASEPSWGIWSVPESELHLIDDVAGLDAIELGCGTAYVSAWLARRGARPVGVDVTEAQLATARRLQAAHGLHFPLIHASAEEIPLPDASFDLAISEYGASIWCAPERWIAEASRLLRPGGRLVFLVNGTLLMLTWPDATGSPAGDRLLRPYFGMRAFTWAGEESVSFHLGYGEMIRLLRTNGFDIEDLVEIRPPEGATTSSPDFDLDWSRQWPCEEVWIARKRD
jgi:SAM-dependent methyltransferase